MRRTYVRPMDGWWRRDPFFMRYMGREATAVFVVVYAVIVLVTVARLAQGEASYAAWLETLRSPASIALHALLLAAFVCHTYTWFAIMPKTMPAIRVAGRRLTPAFITSAGIGVSVVLSAALFFAVKALAP